MVGCGVRWFTGTFSRFIVAFEEKTSRRHWWVSTTREQARQCGRTAAFSLHLHLHTPRQHPEIHYNEEKETKTKTSGRALERFCNGRADRLFRLMSFSLIDGISM
ncbi:hypothetical protein QLX08_009712 [Tetragonisca angustula]|uniref:Secreted protein n=1 Tax=Tetragonisca angustula TaxID=166442 RepID=A0AAW0ZF21_9HYME